MRICGKIYLLWNLLVFVMLNWLFAFHSCCFFVHCIKITAFSIELEILEHLKKGTLKLTKMSTDRRIVLMSLLTGTPPSEDPSCCVPFGDPAVPSQQFTGLLCDHFLTYTPGSFLWLSESAGHKNCVVFWKDHATLQTGQWPWYSIHPRPDPGHTSPMDLLYFNVKPWLYIWSS